MRQPPEKSATGRSRSAGGEAEPREQRGRARARRVPADRVEPRVPLGQRVAVVIAVGLDQRPLDAAQFRVAVQDVFDRRPGPAPASPG